MNIGPYNWRFVTLNLGDMLMPAGLVPPTFTADAGRIDELVLHQFADAWEQIDQVEKAGLVRAFAVQMGDHRNARRSGRTTTALSTALGIATERDIPVAFVTISERFAQLVFDSTLPALCRQLDVDYRLHRGSALRCTFEISNSIRDETRAVELMVCGKSRFDHPLKIYGFSWFRCFDHTVPLHDPVRAPVYETRIERP